MESIPETLTKEYRLRFSENQGYRNSVWQVLCDDYFSRYIPRGSTVLDLGAGWGEFINNLDAAVKWAMDLNPETRERLRPDVRFIEQDCSTEWPLPPNSLDIVFTSNFFEHLPDKGQLERTIAEVHRCLKPDGTLICLGPNVKYVPGAYWDFWDHFVPLTELSLSEVLRMSGFTIENCIGRFLPYTMSSGRRAPLVLVKLYLKMPFVWRFFGHQFLVVGRKTPVRQRLAG